jgi:hypothetical protein
MKTETGPNNQGNEQVHIKIDNVVYLIHRGSHTVAELKTIGKVPAADELEELVNGELKPLDDNGRVTIKGGEVFISHVRSGASS